MCLNDIVNVVVVFNIHYNQSLRFITPFKLFIHWTNVTGKTTRKLIAQQQQKIYTERERETINTNELFVTWQTWLSYKSSGNSKFDRISRSYFYFTSREPLQKRGSRDINKQSSIALIWFLFPCKSCVVRYINENNEPMIEPVYWSQLSQAPISNDCLIAIQFVMRVNTLYGFLSVQISFLFRQISK